MASQERIWTCTIGGEIPDEIFAPENEWTHWDVRMRRAVEKAFLDLFGVDAQFTFSGWGGELHEAERAAVENRPPDPEKV